MLSSMSDNTGVLSRAVSLRSTWCGEPHPRRSGLIGGGLVVWGDGSGGAVDGDVSCRVFSGLWIVRLLCCLLLVQVFGADFVWGAVAEA
jgi:hypothetical protein